MKDSFDREGFLASLSTAANNQEWERIISLLEGCPPEISSDGEAQFYLGLALLSSGRLTQGREVLAQLTRLDPPATQAREHLACKALLVLGVNALASGNTRESEQYLSQVLALAEGSSDPERCAAAIQAGHMLGQLREESGDKPGAQMAYLTAIEKAPHVGQPPVLERAAEAALFLAFSIDNDDVKRMQALSAALDMAMRSRTDKALDIARLATGAILPLAFTAHRHPIGKELQLSKEGKDDQESRAGWFAINFKLDEARYFFDQIRANNRYPKLMFYYISAFLSSARSVTFHIQKMLAYLPDAVTAKQRYEHLRDQLLSDPIAKYFIDRRDVSEKEGHPPVSFSLLKRHRNEQTQEDVWTQLAHLGPMHITARELDYAESSLLRGGEPIFPGQGVPVSIEPVWTWDDYPGGSKEVVKACEDYLERLSFFVAKLREAISSSQDSDRPKTT